MKQKVKNNLHDNIYISPHRLVKLVNDKCLSTLGYKIINTIYNSPNKKTIVEFTDGAVLNYANYRMAFEHLNIAYNLKLNKKIENKEKVTIETSPVNVSKLDVAKNKLKALLLNFKNSKNVKLNNIVLYDYFDSSEWKKNEFNYHDINEIMDFLEDSHDNLSKKYINVIKRILK